MLSLWRRGQRYLDAISSWWVNLHGHAHPYIAEKIGDQAQLLEHVIFADFTHPPAIEFASRLLALLPSTMSKIFYSDNGSTAIEVALKLAIQFWYNQGKKKHKVICFRRASMERPSEPCQLQVKMILTVPSGAIFSRSKPLIRP